MCYLWGRTMRRTRVGAKTRRAAARARIGLVLAAALAFSGPVSGQDVTAKPAEASRTLGPLEKSLVLPGWGQLSEKHYLEGVLFLAAEAAALTGVFLNNHLGNENYALYKKAETLEDTVRARLLTERYDRRRNGFLLAAAAVWAANLLDISLIVKSGQGGEKKLSLGIVHGAKDLIGLTASCRF